MPLTLGTAKLLQRDGYFVLNWMNHGSFLVGEMIFANVGQALRFCFDRDLRVIETWDGPTA